MKKQKDLLSNFYEFINIDKVDKMECSRCKHLYKLEFIKMINNKVYCLVCVPQPQSYFKKDENMIESLTFYQNLENKNFDKKTGNKNDEYPVKEIIMSAFTIIDDYE